MSRPPRLFCRHDRAPYLLCWGALAAYLSVVWAIALLHGQTPARAWRELGINSFDAPFHDLGFVANAIATATDTGLPYAPSADPAFGTYIYPRLWLSWGRIGLSLETYLIWGVFVALAFWIISLVLLRPRTLAEGAMTAALWCSPAFMLAIERGNVDLVVFSVLALAVLLQRRWPALGTVGYLVAAMAKLYPLAAGAALLSPRLRRRWGYAGGLFGAFLAYAWLRWDDLRWISRHAPRDIELSFGCAVPLQSMGATPAVAWGVGALGALVLALLAILGVRRLPELPESARIALLAGAGTYGGAFLLGNNFEYRLVIVLLCLPALWCWRSAPERRARRFATCGLVLLVLATWWTILGPWVPYGAFAGRQVATFGFFALLAPAFLSALGLRNGRGDTSSNASAAPTTASRDALPSRP